MFYRFEWLGFALFQNVLQIRLPRHLFFRPSSNVLQIGTHSSLWLGVQKSWKSEQFQRLQKISNMFGIYAKFSLEKAILLSVKIAGHFLKVSKNNFLKCPRKTRTPLAWKETGKLERSLLEFLANGRKAQDYVEVRPGARDEKLVEVVLGRRDLRRRLLHDGHQLGQDFISFVTGKETGNHKREDCS